jgi:hypothetical protein
VEAYALQLIDFGGLVPSGTVVARSVRFQLPLHLLTWCKLEQY